MRLRLLAAGCVAVLLARAAMAADVPPPGEWDLCPIETPPTVPRYGDDLIHVLADRAFLNPRGVSRLEGHVQLTRGDQTLLSETLDFDNATQLAVSPGPLTLETPDMRLTGASGQYDLARQTGSLDLAQYRLFPAHAHGQAARIDRQGPGRTALKRATYSTCPIGRRAWQLSASEVHLDQAEDEGTARNVLIRFKGVPILYTPYLSFPLSNRRKSGLLPPMVGQSSNTGFLYRQPIYWNIAPQADATFTPEYFATRGFGLGTQLRYLSPHSRSELNTDYIPYDRQFGGARYLLSLRQQANPLPRLSTYIDYNRVSDPNYFNDFGTTLQNVDTTFLGQGAGASYGGEDWSLSAFAQRYQLLDPSLPASAAPYAILPQINLDAHLPYTPDRLQFSVQTQWARFTRPDSVIGNRLDVLPSVRLPLSGPYWFLTPQVAYRYTAYQLQNQLPGDPTTPSRSLPIASLDSGLYFERNAGAHTLQILEPRLFYLYVPYRDQQALPIFDTTVFPLTFSQLFADNRYIGADRVSNADQLTAAVTTRFVDTDTGRQLMSASLGQIFYFQPQQVALPGQPLDAAKRSDYVSQLNVAIANHWWTTAGINLNPTTHQIDTGNLVAQYRLAQNRLVNVGYQYYRGQYDQISLSLAWPLTRHWQFAGSWSYSPQTRQMLQAFAGLQYDSCCWAFRLLAQRYLTTLNGSYNEGISFELVLKGLGNLGSPIGTYLQRTIPDYVPPA